jgi:hypothetical protein
LAGELKELIQVGKHEGKVGVAISGGLDSTILLHLLKEKGNDITAYTMRWGDDGVEADASSKIAAHYGVKHTIISFTPSYYWKTLDLCMFFYDRPRWAIWPHMSTAKEDGVETFYIGEGCDEIFGYQDRCYLRGWCDLIEYHLPPWRMSATWIGIDLITPFFNIETSVSRNEGMPVTLPLHYGTMKESLWLEFRDELPKAILYPKKVSIPTYYSILGLTKDQLQVEATKRWLKYHA